jgi:hypothetical protein
MTLNIVLSLSRSAGWKCSPVRQRAWRDEDKAGIVAEIARAETRSVP